MKEEYKLKGKFTQRWLANSDEYYSPIFVRLYYAQYNFLKQNPPLTDDVLQHLMKGDLVNSDDEIDQMLDPYQKAWYFVNMGIDYFTLISDSISGINRSFNLLLEAGELATAKALIRIQLDNLTYIMAELKHPFRVFYKVYFKGKNLSQVKIAGKNLNPTEIRKEAATEYADLAELYNTYSSFIHPSMSQLQYHSLNRRFGTKKVTKKEKKEVAQDMVKVNTIMTTLLQCQIFHFNTHAKRIKEQINQQSDGTADKVLVK